MSLPVDLDGSSHPTLYHYTPSAAAAYTFMGIFGVGAIVHVFYLFRLRQAFFIPLILGCILETGGYYGRAWGHRDPFNFKAFILQFLPILVAPIFIAATIYMSLARIMAAVKAESSHCWISPRWMAKLFVFLDILCFVVQMAGAGMQCTTDSSLRKTGEKVTIVGLVLQILATAIFLLSAIVFERRLSCQPTAVTGTIELFWKRQVWTIDFASVMVMARNIFRIAEYAEGPDGSASSSEAYIYVFDAAAIALVAWCFIVVHPGRLLRAVRRHGQAGKSSLDGPLLMT